MNKVTKSRPAARKNMPHCANNSSAYESSPGSRSALQKLGETNVTSAVARVNSALKKSEKRSMASAP